ncbi:class I SAM-dependent methyltransferase [Chitinophaga rhizophila]|uniref:Class I SAM-dependent methyltransferase n=1 Tax=Chitinophaga rhizophila TaxID=2866212 RepID=A0ABS7GH59_9BACT|nr:class I SAM-dependent methyltransferase [Chitinophaga rhizophila]MBW8687027.1 class I SAM-dependent methyltransferase [Chitinophaga rhizophila]
MDSRQLWNERYTKGLPSLETPDPFFLTMYETYVGPQFPTPGLALDLAAGTGRHTRHLAEAGWNVCAVDISDVAMEQLSAASSALQVQTVCADLSGYTLPPATYDLIVLYYHFDRKLFPEVIQALRPGGILISKQAVGKPANPAALQEKELLLLTTGLTCLSYGERPVRDRGVAEYVGKLLTD